MKGDRLKELIPRFWFCVLFTFPFFVRKVDFDIQWLLATIIFAVGSSPFFKKGWKKKKINIFSLISLAIGILYVYSSFEMLFAKNPNIYFGTVASITTIFLLEQIMEVKASIKAFSILQALIDRLPKTAQKLFRDAHSETVAVDQLKPQDSLRVAQGDIIAADGIIYSGDIEVEESFVTGDKNSVKKGLGHIVYAGATCLKGSCLIRVARAGKECIISQIIDAVQEGVKGPSSSEEKREGLEKAVQVGVFFFAALGFLFWAMFAGLGNGLLVASSILVGLCPCAMRLSHSLVKKIALFQAASQGIIVKVAKAFDAAARCNVLVTNKNGTLTIGKPKIISIDPVEKISPDEVLVTAAALEAQSNHPYAKCIVQKAKAADFPIVIAKELEEVPALGVKGKIDEVPCLIGDEKFMQGIDLGPFQAKAEKMRREGYIVLFCARDKKLLGILVLSDPIRQDVKETLKTFKKQAFQLFCLSGDRRVTIVQLVNILGFDRFQAEAAANQKVQTVKKLQKEGKTVMMVSDPANDADALFQANSGIALGTRGKLYDEKAEITILKGNLSSTLRVLDLSKRAVGIERMNVLFSSLFMVVMLFMALFGAMGPTHAAFYMMLSTFVVEFNSFRLILPETPEEEEE